MNISSVLLLGGENILALPVIRSLGTILPDANIHTYSPANQGTPISERSKYIHSRHYFNSWNEINFPKLLQQKIEETEADIIFPVSDESVRMLAALKEDLESLVYLPPLPALDVYDQLERKDLLADFLQENQYPCAQTMRLKDTEPDELAARQFPLMLKPISGSSGIGIQKLDNKNELIEILKNSEINRDNYILQEYIPGRDYGCSVLAIDGEIKAVTIQRVLANKNFGVATAIRFVRDKRILRTTEKVLKETGYSGVAHLDYRVDSRDNEPKLIDFNARFWHSLLGSKAAGIDFVFLTCLAAAGFSFEKPDYHNVTYFVGNNTLRYYLKEAFRFRKTNGHSSSVFTDIWDRVRDPVPEIARYVNRPTFLK